MNQQLDRKRLFLNLLPIFLKKDMFRQFQMIQLPEMPKVMAPCHGTMGQDNVYHFLKSCMIVFKKHNILSINMWKLEDLIFLYIPTELE